VGCQGAAGPVQSHPGRARSEAQDDGCLGDLELLPLGQPDQLAVGLPQRGERLVDCSRAVGPVDVRVVIGWLVQPGALRLGVVALPGVATRGQQQAAGGAEEPGPSQVRLGQVAHAPQRDHEDLTEQVRARLPRPAVEVAAELLGVAAVELLHVRA
jgi:hypothetical protein